MKIINWITYLFYRFFLVCGKDDWDSKYTAKLFSGVFIGFSVMGLVDLIICINHPERQDFYLTPFNGALTAVIILIYQISYYWNKWNIKMKDIAVTYDSWSKRKQKWMLAVPIIADIISYLFCWTAYNIVKYFY